jgi:predicted enzyme related to lactoylglutathione lyase
MIKTKTLALILVVGILIVSLSYFAFAAPNGISVSAGTSTGGGSNAAGADSNAIAGNVTELTLTANSSTQSWQGYYGNVSGVIDLRNSAGDVLYNWSLATPTGEIYASNASTITWGGIQCYDHATNNTFFESMFGIGNSDPDGINETFNLDDHSGFITNQVAFSTGQCNNTQLFNDAGIGTFEEVLLTDGTELVFASLLQNDVVGFDNIPHDFEMIVLEDGHNEDTSTTVYYFWAELE